MQTICQQRQTHGGTNLKKQVYTQQVISNIRATAQKTLAVYIAIAVFFAIFCGIFCYLAIAELASIYLCCALNIVATICFLWYTYLFFAVISQPIFAKRKFIKLLDTCLPVVMVAKLLDCQLSSDGYYVLALENNKTLKLDQSNGPLKTDVTYKIEQVNDIVLTYCEVQND